MRFITSSKRENVESLLNVFHDLSLRATSEGSLGARKIVQSWVSPDLNQWQGCMSLGGNLIIIIIHIYIIVARMDCL